MTYFVSPRSFRNAALALMLGLSAGSLMPQQAKAQGFFGGIIEQVVPGAGRALDDWNRNSGRPVEQTGAAILDFYYPGAGRAALMGQRLQDQGVFDGRAPQLGNFCHTPIGRFGPGPINPVGTPCHVNGVQGQVGN